MTFRTRNDSDLPSSYVDPIAERREHPYKNTPAADAYNARLKASKKEPTTPKPVDEVK